MWMVLAVAAAIRAEEAIAAAADRFVPADSGFVVADLRDAQPDAPMRGLIARWRSAPGDEQVTLALAAAFIDRARMTREPRFFGRAEAVLHELARRPGAAAALRRLYAETLQFRHDFAGAAAVLDSLLRDNTRDTDARLRRAALRLTTGDFSGARADCFGIATSGTADAAVGWACLAESLAATGELARARTLLGLPGIEVAEPGPRAYLLATRASLDERAGESDAAIEGFREALALTPRDDALRAALADALARNGERRAALEVLAVTKPGLGLLVRAAALERGHARDLLMRRSRDRLALEAARGDAPHDREAALLDIAAGSPASALAAARRNFARQRELVDVRLLAHAAVLSGDAAARAQLRQWLADTRYQDAVTENLLRGRPPG